MIVPVIQCPSPATATATNFIGSAMPNVTNKRVSAW
jgi:hypothetical protein